jgi:hypothetical protein
VKAGSVLVYEIDSTRVQANFAHERAAWLVPRLLKTMLKDSKPELSKLISSKMGLIMDLSVIC